MRPAVSSRAVAELFLASHGTDALRVLAEAGHLKRLDPPPNWRAGPTTESFVQSLGFPADCAGTTVGRRDPVDIVQGPITLNPLHPDYQVGVYDELLSSIRAFKERSRVMVSLPTGAGKTRIVVEAVVDGVLANRHGARLALWVAQKDELCEQAVQCFRHVWANKGTEDTDLHVYRLWGGGRESRPPAPGQPCVVVASIQTLNRRFDRETMSWLRAPSVVVVDEAHHAIAPTCTGLRRWLMDSEGADPGPVIGLSATPYRGYSEESSLRLKNRFGGVLLPAADVQEGLWHRLRDDGFLARVEHDLLETHVALDLLDDELEQIGYFQNLIFPEGASQRLAEDAARNAAIVGCVLKLADDGQVLLFANTKEHAQLLAGLLVLRDCRAAAIVGDTRKGVRQQFVTDFKSGDLRVLCNYEVLTTGFDAPKIDAVAIARLTFSPVLYQQMIGRGLRGQKNGGKPTCRIVTVVDNYARFDDKLAYHHFEELWRSEALVPSPD
jgi:superfamily II DNA or RNA helicase